MKELRFRVTDNQGRFGSSWTVRANPANGDVVVSHREAGRWVHATFHKATGEWHFAVTGSGTNTLPVARSYLGSLREHVEVAPGWNHAMRISVAVDELRSGWSEDVRERPLTAIPTNEGFDEVVIDLFLGRADRAELELHHAYLVGDFNLGDGDVAAVVARPARVDEPLRSILAGEFEEAVAGIRASGWDGQTTTRLVIIGVHDDGYLKEVEMAVDPD